MTAMRRAKKGLSIVLSSVIMTAMLLLITVVAFEFSISILSAQAQSSEFQQTQNDLLLLADVIEDVSLKPASAGYVTFSSQSGAMSFVTNASAMSINVTAAGDTRTLWEGSASSLNYRAGLQAGGVVDKFLRGSASNILQNQSVPLTRVYLKYDGAPYAVLDSRNVRIMQLGTFYYSNRGDNQSGYLNVVEVTLLNITFGKIAYSNPLNIKATNKAIVVPPLTVFLNDQVNLNFSVKIDNQYTNYQVNGPSTTLQGDQVSGTMVRFVYLEVYISSVWGG